jgi:hypothetical protein
MKPRITLLTIGVDDLAFFDLQAGLKLAIWARDDLAHDTGSSCARPSEREQR